MIDALKKNDKVLTTAGIYGTVVSVDAEHDRVVLRVDDDRGVKVAFTKASIVRVLDAPPSGQGRRKAAAADAGPAPVGPESRLVRTDVDRTSGPARSDRRHRASRADRPIEAGTGRPSRGRILRHVGSSRIATAGPQGTTMKKFGGKFALIAVTDPRSASLAIWPPEEKLKLGIDLSGGTILVYEVKKENLPANFNMDELITALKQRVNPEGVHDIPIRKIGSNRIEIILPKADGRGGRGGQAEADRRRLARVPHPGQPQARRRRRSTGPSAPTA